MLIKEKGEQVCPKCGGRGLILKDRLVPCQGKVIKEINGVNQFVDQVIKRREVFAVQCDCIKRRKFKNANLPERLKNISFNDFDCNRYSNEIYTVDGRGQTYREKAVVALSQARLFAREFLQGKRDKGLLFTGDVGSGKTLLAAAIANEVIANTDNKTVSFVSVPRWLDEMKYTFNTPKGKTAEVTEKDLMNNAIDVDLLILDDLGAHKYSEYTEDRLYNVLNERLNNYKTTIITTNLTEEGLLREKIGERSFSRFFELCDTIVLTHEGGAKGDIRIKQKRVLTEVASLEPQPPQTKLKSEPKPRPQLHQQKQSPPQQPVPSLFHRPTPNHNYDVKQAMQKNPLSKRNRIKPENN
ncbi:ATP-binding protein [Peptococcaceae bacterium 1198_IL3148]